MALLHRLRWPLEAAFEAWPLVDWPLHQMSGNRGLRVEYIVAAVDRDGGGASLAAMRWNWNAISRRTDVTTELVLARPDLPFTECLSDNPRVDWRVLSGDLRAVWKLSRRLAWDEIAANPQLEWDPVRLSESPAVTPAIMDAHPEIPWHFGTRLLRFPPSWGCAEGRDTITGLMAAGFLRPSVAFGLASFTESMIPEVRPLIDEHKAWAAVSRNPGVAPEWIAEHAAEFPWCWAHVGGRECRPVPWEFIVSRPELAWDWTSLSLHFPVTLEILADPRLPWFGVPGAVSGWDWDRLSLNAHVTDGLVGALCGARWRYDFLSMNPAITWRALDPILAGAAWPGPDAVSEFLGRKYVPLDVIARLVLLVGERLANCPSYLG